MQVFKRNPPNSSKGTTTKKVGVAALGDKILNSTAFWGKKFR